MLIARYTNLALWRINEPRPSPPKWQVPPAMPLSESERRSFAAVADTLFPACHVPADHDEDAATKRFFSQSAGELPLLLVMSHHHCVLRVCAVHLWGWCAVRGARCAVRGGWKVEGGGWRVCTPGGSQHSPRMWGWVSASGERAHALAEHLHPPSARAGCAGGNG